MKKQSKVLLIALMSVMCMCTASCALFEPIDSSSSSDSSVEEKVYYTVTFETDGGNAMDAMTVEHGANLSEVAAPTKQGYVFDGWTVDGAAYDVATEITGNITLTATWKAPRVRICSRLLAQPVTSLSL